jgi:hypothetical protein
LNGEYPVIPALQGGVKGYDIKETPCRKAPPFRAESFNCRFSFVLDLERTYLMICDRATWEDLEASPMK